MAESENTTDGEQQYVPPVSPAVAALAGTILDGKYKLGEVIGSGAMAHIFAAEQIRLGRAVAVKLLRSPLASDSRSLERFNTEALAASRVNHPHAAAIYDMGVTAAGVPFLVLERLRGPDLADLCANESLSIARIISIGAQILAALDEAHGCGVIHRDLKTENVVIETRRDGADFVKVVDFGIAALVDRPESGVVGTPEYMAPEQIRGEVAQTATDLYATGILLYELVTGETPFAGGSVAEILERHLGQAPRPPGELTTCPDDLAHVILRALAKEPADRWETAAAMRAALLECSHDRELAPARRPAGTPQPRRKSHRLSRGSRPTVDVRPRTAERAHGSGPSAGLVGRDQLLGDLTAFLAGETDSKLRSVALVGPVGVGKASMVRAVTHTLRSNGMRVLVTGPDPSGYGETWMPITTMVAELLDIPSRPTRGQLVDAMERAGLSERDASGITELFGLPGAFTFLDGAARHAEATAATLAVLCGVAGKRVLAFLDVDRFDIPSRELVIALVAALGEGNLRVVVTSSSAAVVPSEARPLPIAGLNPTDSHALFSRHAGAARAMRVSPGEVGTRTAGLPMALIHLGNWVAAGNDLARAPEKIVDLVADQLSLLAAPARRVLQAIATLGRVVDRARLAEVVGADAELGLAGLMRAGLVSIGDREVTIIDDVVAQVAVSCTPAEARRELAARILDVAGAELSTPARAHLAEAAGTLHAALGLNITAGDEARRRFDHARASTLYHRAVTIARRLQSQGDADAAERLVVASLRLADVLIQSGKLAAASGCLDEAELSGATPTQLASVGRQRGRIAAGWGQTQVAMHLYRRAIGLALRAGMTEVCLDAYLDLADTLAAAGRLGEATDELTEGLAVLSLGEGLVSGAGPDRLWELGWRLAHLHARGGDAKKAREIARAALQHAEVGKSTIGQGRLHALLAALSRRLADVSDALVHRAMARDAAEDLITSASPA